MMLCAMLGAGYTVVKETGVGWGGVRSRRRQTLNKPTQNLSGGKCSKGLHGRE